MGNAQYGLILLVVGTAALLAAWLPAYTARRPLSLPIVLVAVGVVIGLVGFGLPEVDPRRHLEVTTRLTEIGVIVALMGAGLRIDRPFSLRGWGSTWRMVGIAMPLTILAVAILGFSVGGLSVAAALLLGAVMAPTDPVLAGDVQVGEPTLGPDLERGSPEDEVRFTLTSEGGLNDALAFPFVWGAIWLAQNDAGLEWSSLFTWLAWDVAGRVVLGMAVGVAVGRLMGTVSFRPPGPLTALANHPQAFIALAATFIAYGAAELIHGYGFLAVFVAAVAVVFVVRPLLGQIALVGTKLTPRERWTISFFGIRGFGSVYYLAFALLAAPFAGSDQLWATVAATLLLSVVVHGVMATPAMDGVDRETRARLRFRRGRR